MAVTKFWRHELASFSQRYTAFNIDIGIGFVTGWLACELALAVGASSGWAVAGFMAYVLARDALPGGQSLGRRLVRARVAHVASGKPCRLWQSVLRNIPLLVLGVFDVLLALGKQRRRLGDRLARTRVVQAVPVASRSEQPPPRPSRRWAGANWLEAAAEAVGLAFTLSGASLAAVFGRVMLALLLAAIALGLVLRIARRKRRQRPGAA